MKKTLLVVVVLLLVGCAHKLGPVADLPVPAGWTETDLDAELPFLMGLFSRSFHDADGRQMVLSIYPMPNDRQRYLDELGGRIAKMERKLEEDGYTDIRVEKKELPKPMGYSQEAWEAFYKETKFGMEFHVEVSAWAVFGYKGLAEKWVMLGYPAAMKKDSQESAQGIARRLFGP